MKKRVIKTINLILIILMCNIIFLNINKSFAEDNANSLTEENFQTPEISDMSVADLKDEADAFAKTNSSPISIEEIETVAVTVGKRIFTISAGILFICIMIFGTKFMSAKNPNKKAELKIKFIWIIISIVIIYGAIGITELMATIMTNVTSSDIVSQKAEDKSINDIIDDIITSLKGFLVAKKNDKTKSKTRPMITLFPSYITCSYKKGKKYQIKVNWIRQDLAKSSEIKFTSSNKDVCTVDSKGKITLKSEGEAIIKATCPKDKNVIGGNCVVKIYGGSVEFSQYHFTGIDGYEKKILKKFQLPNGYICSSTSVQPMWYVARLNTAFKGTSKSGKEVSIPKNQYILVVNQKSREANKTNTCIIQYGDDAKEVVEIKYKYLDYVQEATNCHIEYTEDTATNFVNKHDISSSTDYMLWVNKHTQRCYLFKGSNHNWVLQKGTIKGKLGNNNKATTWKGKKNSVLVSTGSYKYGLSRDVMQEYNKYKIFKKDEYFYSNGYNIYHYMHYTGLGGSGLHGGGGRGKPLSHQCIRFDNGNRDFIWYTVPLNTRIVNY